MPQKPTILTERCELLLQAQEKVLLQTIGEKLAIPKKNIRGKIKYSQNDIIRKCIHYTASQLGIVRKPSQGGKRGNKGLSATHQV